MSIFKDTSDVNPNWPGPKKLRPKVMYLEQSRRIQLSGLYFKIHMFLTYLRI